MPSDLTTPQCPNLFIFFEEKIMSDKVGQEKQQILYLAVYQSVFSLVSICPFRMLDELTKFQTVMPGMTVLFLDFPCIHFSFHNKIGLINSIRLQKMRWRHNLGGLYVSIE